MLSIWLSVFSSTSNTLSTDTILLLPRCLRREVLWAALNTDWVWYVHETRPSSVWIPDSTDFAQPPWIRTFDPSKLLHLLLIWLDPGWNGLRGGGRRDLLHLANHSCPQGDSAIIIKIRPATMNMYCNAMKIYWTHFRKIDEESPFYGMSARDFLKKR